MSNLNTVSPGNQQANLPFMDDGSLNPAWVQEIHQRDELTQVIKASFLSGILIKEEIVCFATPCVMKSRRHSFAIEEDEENAVGYNPMLFCFLCNRTFHAGCYDLGPDLISEQQAPWRCRLCIIQPKNDFSSAYRAKTGYNRTMIERRRDFLNVTAPIESAESIVASIYTPEDFNSFARRAAQIVNEDYPDADNQESTFLLMSQAMKVRSDRHAAQMQALRYQNEIERAHDEIETLQQQIQSLRNGAQSQVNQNNAGISQYMPSNRDNRVQFQTSAANANGNRADAFRNRATEQNDYMQPSNSGNRSNDWKATNVLSNHYLRRDTTAHNERSTFNYRPNPVQRSQIRSHNASRRTDMGMPDELANLVERLTISQERTEERHLLAERRKATPKISDFSGEDSKWLTFVQDVERYRVSCQYDAETIKQYVRGALKGNAYILVKDIIDSASLDIIMATLKSAFGDEMKLVRNRSEEVMRFRFNSALNKSEAVKLQAVIQSYFSACNYANIGYLNANSLGEAVFNQFNVEDRLRCKEFYRRRNPEMQTIIMDIQTVYDYLLHQLPMLDDAPIRRDKAENKEKKEDKQRKPYQVNNVNSSSTQNNDAFKFEIRDQIRAAYLGYNMSKVQTLNKKCEICNSTEHFTIECDQYRSRNEENRLRLCKEKQLCRNCMLTTAHKASNCELKSGCGFKTDNLSRCTGKHHVSFHSAAISEPKSSGSGQFGFSNRRKKPKTNSNTAKAHERINEAVQKADSKANESTNATSSSTVNAMTNFHALDPKDAPEYCVYSADAVTSESPRTVKVFKVTVFGPKGRCDVMAIGDSASEVTLMRDDLRQALGITGTQQMISLRWAERSTHASMVTKCDVQIKGICNGAGVYEMKGCFSTDTLELPRRSLNMEILRSNYPNLINVPFESYTNEMPVMLIGGPHAFLIEGCELIDNGIAGPVAVRTKLGWSVYGGLNMGIKKQANVHAITQTDSDVESDSDESAILEFSSEKVSNEQLSDMLKRFFAVESLGIQPKEVKFTQDEQQAVDTLVEGKKTLENGHVEVPLLWKRIDDSIPKLPNNYALVLKRQQDHEKKLLKNPSHMQAFNDNMKALLEQGFVREADDEDMKSSWNNIWYLPMTLVINTNKNPPKFRNVFDASCTYKGSSLNGSLLKGPDYLVNIINPLIKMRENQIAFTADVKAMFNMIWINKSDQQCQRILWRENPQEPMKTYISNVMLFGPTCSPFISQYVKNDVAHNWESKYPAAAKTLLQFTYMDDILTSESSVENATNVAKQCIEICDSIQWQLVGFQSNSTDLLRALPDSVIKREALPLIESEDESYVTKVLGCYWNTVEDCFEFKLEENLFVKLVNEFDQRPTKRDQASTIARFYDVLGLISNFTIRGKILLQRSWAERVNWDQPVNDEISKEWKAWLNQVKDVSQLKFRRCFSSNNALADADSIELHIFCDAGKEAFGAVAYLVVRKNDLTETSIIMAKAKVTPLRLKTETLIREMPRLELMAALLAARLGKTISTALKPYDLRRHYWSDSEVVLRWILNPNQKLLKYAIAPVEEILDLTFRSEWRYVPSKLNVADLCTKMKKFDFSDNNSVWMLGPSFLRQATEHWPYLPEKLLEDNSWMANNMYLEKLNYSSHELPAIDCTFANDSAIDRFKSSIKSSWMKLVRATARALKLHMDGFASLVRSKQWAKSGVRAELCKLMDGFNFLSASDLERAEHFIFRKIQREEFSKEYQLLRQGKAIRNQMMLELNVFMDPQGLIRINSRVNLNSMSFPQQFVPLLPRRNPLVRLFLNFYHQKYKHIMPDSQEAEIRTKAWIPQLKAELKTVKEKCQVCRLMRARPYEPSMAPLPTDRVNPDLKPFEVVGVDVLGPINTINYGKSKKIWIMIFTCALTRFIHLHILDSLESLRVLEAIVIFWSAHGPVRKFISDNGTNFKGAARALREDFELAQQLQRESNKLATKLSEKFSLDWQFISPHSPWFGGMYERLVKEVKRALRETLQNRKLNRIEFNIGVHEAAHRINCRPLTYNSIHAENGEILTPHHLAKGRSGWPIPPGLHKNKYEEANDKSIYRRGRALADDLMRKFTASYLPELTRRTKWHTNTNPPKKGDLVLLIEPNQTRQEWRRGRIIKLHPGRDGRTRVADVELPDKSIKKNRAARNLAKIDVSTEPESSLQYSVNVLQFAKDSDVTNIGNLKVENANANCESQIKYKHKLISQLKIKRGEMRKKSAKYIVKVAELNALPPEVLLSEIVEPFHRSHSNLFGLARRFNFQQKINGETIYLYFVEPTEAANSVAGTQVAIAGNEYSIAYSNVSIASAKYPVPYKNMNPVELNEIPHTVTIFGIRQLATVYPFYIRELLKHFESKVNVLGFRFCIDDSTGYTRSFAFLILSSRKDAMELDGYECEVYSDRLKVAISDSMSMLVNLSDKMLLDSHNHMIFGNEAKQINQLCVTNDAKKVTSTRTLKSVIVKPIAITLDNINKR